MPLHPIRTGAVLGLLIGLFHTAWATLVAFHVAQPLVDLVLALHMIKVTVTIAPFDPGLATTLVILTGAVGFVMGAGFAFLWNLVHRAPDVAIRPAAVLH